jgi:putative PIN family toxin of toxin-antitoxin system
MSVLVVLDTNLVVSAGIQPAGHPARIVDAALAGAIVPVVCPAITTEYVEVVNRARFKKWKFPPQWLNALIAGAHLVDQELPAWPSVGPDPDDLVFLALAHRTGAVLVTGNIADYPKDIRHGVEVMDPATYVRHLQALGVRW